MILQKNLGMTPPYYSGRGRYTKGFNDFRTGTLNQHSFLLYVYHVSTIIVVIIIMIRNNNNNNNNNSTLVLSQEKKINKKNYKIIKL